MSPPGTQSARTVRAGGPVVDPNPSAGRVRSRPRVQPILRPECETSLGEASPPAAVAAVPIARTRCDLAPQPPRRAPRGQRLDRPTVNRLPLWRSNFYGRG